MENKNQSFIHDTINLDEIRKLLGEDSVADDFAEEAPVVDAPSTEPAEVEHELVSDDAEAPAEPSGSDLNGEPEAEKEEAEEEDDGIEIPSFVRMEDPKPVMPEESAPATAEEPEQQQEHDPSPEKEAESVPVEKRTVFVKKRSEPSEEQSVSGEEKETKPAKKKTSAAFELYSMLHDVIYLLAAVTLIFVFVVRLVGVQGDSMLPTLHNRDFLILESNFLYGDNFRYGDVVVLSTPGYEMEGDHPIVKRVIATEGDEVNIDFETGAVYVNGVMLHETYINTPTNYNWDGEYGLEYPAVVPENCIFVLGDNRNNSMDSRYAPIGMVDERCVLGKVLLIALPGQTVDNAGNVIAPRDWGRIGLVS